MGPCGKGLGIFVSLTALVWRALRHMDGIELKRPFDRRSERRIGERV